MNIPPLCFVRFARPAPIIQRGIFWYSVYRHLRLLVSPALLGDLECFIKINTQFGFLIYKDLKMTFCHILLSYRFPSLIILILKKAIRCKSYKNRE